MPINLQNRQQKVFPPFKPSETQIILNGNQITEIPSNIETAINLTHLYVGNNLLKEIPTQIGKLKNLSVLILNHNEIQQIPIQIGDLTQLRQLRLQNNKLTELPKEIGNLKNLTHLFLENNQISFLPEEIKNLKKLVHLSLDANPIVLPENYSKKNAQKTISYILEQQSDSASTDTLITRKAYYFTNASKDSVVQKYKTIINDFASEKMVDFTEINSTKVISKDINVVFIIAPFDIHQNEKLIFEIADKCKKLGVRFYIFTQKGFIEKDYDSVNITKGKEFESLSISLNKKYASEFNNFSSYEEFDNLIFEALKQHKPNIRISKLNLVNIGHFSKLEIDFNKDLTCLIGENGIGKSTILRALALAVIGHNHKKIDEKAKRGFLKIQGFTESGLIYNEGSIRLEYSIDGDKFYNELKFSPNDNGNDITIVPTGDFQIVYNNYNLKTLIVGFPQDRGNDAINHSDFILNKITQPHINDLIPLINNSDDFRLRSFAGWIANLYFDYVKNKENSNEKSKEEEVINEAFAVISKITKKEIKFKTVKAVDPPEVWVTTYDSPNGIPLYMISQGFKIVIGWIGYLLQRFANTFPLSEPKSSFKENAILILDEVDTSIHPVWQTSFIEILRETFPQTQFIFTTHSPLMIAGLDKEQFVELSIQNNEIVALKNQIDTWAFTYRDVLQKLFNTVDPKPKRTIEDLEILMSKTTTMEEKESIKENIARLKEGEQFENELKQYSNKLEEKDKELDKLIKKYKDKTL